MKIATRGAVVGSLALALGSLSACGSGGSSNSDDGGTKTVYLVSSVGTGWQTGYNDAFVKILKDQGVKVTLLEDPFDVAKNVANVNQAIAAKPDVVAVMGISDTALLPSFERAKKAGVPVINLNGRPDDRAIPLIASSLEADNYSQGKFAAENIVEGFTAQGLDKANIIALTGTAATNTVQDRMKGFNEVLAAHPDFKLVAEEDANWDQTKSAQLAQQLFAKYKSQGGVQAAYGMADNQAAGIIQAAKQAGIKVGPNALIVTGSNCYKIGIDSIKAGEQYGTATQAPANEGEWAAGFVAKFVKGEDIPKRELNDEFRVTKANVEEYAAQCSVA